MSRPIPLLETLPPDPTPDSGPLHRGGPLTFFVALTCSVSALGSGVMLALHGRLGWGAASLVLFGALAVRAAWLVADRLRHRDDLPASHAVLTDHLAFRIHCTCRDVAATVFFDPDQVPAIGPVRLLCFLENYASRQRLARLQIGPHPALGLTEPHVVDLRLSAGQAAVYVLPLVITRPLPAGDHDLPVTLTVRKPTGTGVRLHGTHRHLYDLWTVRYVAPFTATTAVPTASSSGSAELPRFLSLASVGEKSPRLDALAFLTD